jgi:hypothetical protein
MIYESVIRPASSGFGLYEVANGPVETSYKSLEDFAECMNKEYSWRWATELDGKIQNQDGGIPFAWKCFAGSTEQTAEAFGLLYVEATE